MEKGLFQEEFAHTLFQIDKPCLVSPQCSHLIAFDVISRETVTIYFCERPCCGIVRVICCKLGVTYAVLSNGGILFVLGVFSILCLNVSNIGEGSLNVHTPQQCRTSSAVFVCYDLSLFLIIEAITWRLYDITERHIYDTSLSPWPCVFQGAHILGTVSQYLNPVIALHFHIDLYGFYISRLDSFLDHIQHALE